MAIQLEEIRARLVADTAQFQAGMQGAQRAMGDVASRSTTTTRTLRTLEGGMRALAFQAAGLPGPLGRITSALLSFAGGTGLVIGVVAGLGAIALAYKKLADAADHAEQVLRDRAKRMMEHLRVIRTVQDEGLLLARRAELQATRGVESGANLVFGGAELDPTKQAGLQNVQRLLDAIDAQLAEIRNQRTKAILEDMQDIERALAGAAANLNLAGIAAFNLERALFPFTPAEGGPPIEDRWLTLPQFIGGLTPEEIRTGVPEGALRGTTDKLAEEFNASMADIGISGMRALLQGLIEGAANIEDILKAFITQLAITAILKPLQLALGIASPSTEGMKIGAAFTQGIALGMVQGAALQFKLDVSGMPPAPNIFASARDNQWQQLLRESSLVALSQGFRFR
jgi:hypothetical protein